MWGALSLLMTLIPSFRDFRLLNVIALAGTGFTAIYICVSAGVHGFTHNAVNLAPYSFQTFFTGANVFLWAYGGHGVSFEVCSPPYCNLLCSKESILTYGGRERHAWGLGLRHLPSLAGLSNCVVPAL